MPEKRASLFARFNSDLMTIVEPGSPYFQEPIAENMWFLNWIPKDLFKWDPKGEPAQFSEACDDQQFRKKILSPQVQGFEQVASLYRAHLNQCEKELETGWNDLFSNSLGAMTIQLDPNHHPFARHVIFHLPNNVILKGLLALKPDFKKRPLVIFRTGIFSNTQTFYPERYFFMQAFDQSPFNVLVLESLSGSEFVKHNTSISLGGFDEGIQNYFIAKALRSPTQPISKIINGIHVFGTSMGGHGVFYTSILDSFNKTNFIDSTLSYCPLLNLRETLDYHRAQGATMAALNFWAKHRIVDLEKRYPNADPSDFIMSIMAEIDRTYQGPLVSSKTENLGFKIPNAGIKFWESNEYWPYYKNIKTPSLIFSSRQDPIVVWPINSGRFEDGRLKFPDSNIQMIPLAQGYHCSMSVAYDWHHFSTFLQTYFLKFSPNVQLAEKQISIPISSEFKKKIAELGAGKVSLKTEFEVEPGFVQARAKIQIFPSKKPGLLEKMLAPKMIVEIPFSETEYAIENPIGSEAEASVLRRWFYQNVRTKIENDQLVLIWSKLK